MPLDKSTFKNNKIAKNHLPITIGEYTDFYSSKNHAFNMGCIIRNP